MQCYLKDVYDLMRMIETKSKSEIKDFEVFI